LAKPGSSTRASARSGTTVDLPYEVALNKALDKLTSEILIFLLAYMILVIALVMLRGSIPDGLRVLLYVIPILGFVGYAWLRKRTVIREPRSSGVSVKALFVKDAYVGGVRGAGRGAEAGAVDVSVAVATGRGTVVGVDQTNVADDLKYLQSIFHQLTESHRRQVITSASQLLDRQKLPS
jgi:hypothetical protein